MRNPREHRNSALLENDHAYALYVNRAQRITMAVAYRVTDRVRVGIGDSALSRATFDSDIAKVVKYGSKIRGGSPMRHDVSTAYLVA